MTFIMRPEDWQWHVKFVKSMQEDKSVPLYCAADGDPQQLCCIHSNSLQMVQLLVAGVIEGRGERAALC